MEQLNTVVSILALTMGAAWASGVNLYAAMFVLGYMGATGSIDLPPTLEILQNPLVMTAAGLMFCVEFFADKIPGVDSGWDVIQTFVRIPAGAVLAAGAVGSVDPALAVAAGLVGGTVTAATHATKASTRVMINASPEPFSNWGASLAEDAAVIAGLWTAVHHPWLFLAMFIAFALFVVWALPKLWRSIMKVFGAVARLFGRGQSNVVLTSAPIAADSSKTAAPVELPAPQRSEATG